MSHIVVFLGILFVLCLIFIELRAIRKTLQAREEIISQGCKNMISNWDNGEDIKGWEIWY